MNSDFKRSEQAEDFQIGKRISLSRPSAKFLALRRGIESNRCSCPTAKQSPTMNFLVTINPFYL